MSCWHGICGEESIGGRGGAEILISCWYGTCGKESIEGRGEQRH